MKGQVARFVKSLGGSTSYSGKTKTMFINGSNSIELSVLEKFGYGLPFVLKTNRKSLEFSI